MMLTRHAVSFCRLTVLSLVPLGAASLAGADVINVPGDQPTIQAGIDAAFNGDEVVVAPGTYAEIIDLMGKAITLRSSGGAAVTTIDATTVPDPGDGKPVVRCDTGEGSDTVIEGFTLTGGTGDTGAFGGTAIGGGMFNGVGVSPTINDCVFTANAVTEGAGGGMFNNEASPTISGCTFSNNSADNGGAMFDFMSAAPVISSSVFSANHALIQGGAINGADGDLSLTGCTFLANTADDAVGGIVFNGDLLTMTNCRVIGNVAESGLAGGMLVHIDPGSAIINCEFIGNVAAGAGGGLYLVNSSFPIVNCTFAGNASSGNGGGVRIDDGSPAITSSIFWGNSDAGGMDESAQIHRNSSPGTTVSYSIVQGGWSGDGSNNLDADPLFVDVDGADDVIGTDDDDVRLLAGSPAIDSGDTATTAALLPDATDLDGYARVADDPATADTGVAVFGVTIDRGPYEFGASALATGACCIDGACIEITEANCTAVGGAYFGDGSACGDVECPAACPADVNGDGAVDVLDLLDVLAAWGPCM